MDLTQEDGALLSHDGEDQTREPRERSVLEGTEQPRSDGEALQLYDY
jgi:hypothetical protein